ncbi:MAG: ABC transporter permease [Chryseotalea sp. WA131a]|jgi:putative ABC transport system permease protein|nr:MAG: ABC transporter permease [Chryseotalea sp. WA131a]
MLNHFLKIFFRTTFKNPSYSFINVAGLAVGFACSIFILLWIIDETTFDKFHADKERIFQVMGNHAFPDGTQTLEQTPGPLAEGLIELPEVEESCRIRFGGGRILFNHGTQSIYENGVFADTSIFSVFTIPLAEGNTTNPLPDINSIAISRKLASKYFKNESALGRVFRLDSKSEAKVTAVFNDLPSNSTLQFDFIIPYPVYSQVDQYNKEWGAWTGGKTYVKLKEGSNVALLNEKIAEVLTKPKIWPRWDSNVELFLFPITDWRLYNNFNNGIQDGGRITYVRIFSIVAGFILLIACINFMNLATARSMNRAKEIGVRKVVGAARRSLTKQFMGESILTSLIAFLFGLFIVELLLTYFNELTGKKLIIDYLNPVISISLISVALLTGLIAGSYPAFFLSSLKAINVLKGKFSGLSGAGIRKGLVVFQFGVSIVLIISALIVYYQVDFMKSKNLGFDKENILYFNVSPDILKNFESFRQELLQTSAIRSVARGDNNPMDNFAGMVLGDNAWPGKAKEDNLIFKTLVCDDYFLPALGFSILEGRNFSKEFTTDTTNYIINEEAVRRMKLSDPIGQVLIAPRKGKIVGVIKDFHSGSLQGPIEPVIFSMRPNEVGQVFIRYEAGKVEQATNHIQTIYKKFESDFPIEYSFMDQTFDRQYQNEILIGKLSSSFTLIAIFISCLGLFGLASFTTERRTKEIGVRKVMGATVYGIVVMLCKDFIRLVIFGILIGCPIGYYVGQQFLSKYAFHAEINIWIFLLTAISVILTTLLIVSYQSIKTALTNPVNVLRIE